MASFKQMKLTGEVKRGRDVFRIEPANIHVEPGFNARRETPALQASIDALTAYIVAGGMIPPLEVRPREEGGVWLVDGHRRARAIAQAIARGTPIEWVEVMHFVGNDLDRAIRVHSSQNGEPLPALDAALDYKKLQAFHLTPEQIAQRVGKTRQHVEQGLILANGPHSILLAVEAGSVSASTAAEMVRKHGDNAGKVLEAELEAAKAKGKTRVTAGTMQGKAPSRKLVSRVVDAASGLVVGLGAAEREKLEAMREPSASDRKISVSAKALLALLDAQAAIAPQEPQS